MRGHRPPPTLEDTFWPKVDRRAAADCWEWLGNVDRSTGYGRIWIGRNIGAHRAAWLISFGEIEDGLYVLHRCDNRTCVNPSHLFLGTHLQNIADCVAKGRTAKGERSGHAKLTEAKVVEIRRLHANGMAEADLARWFGVQQGTISPLIRRKTWRHVA